MSKKKQRKNSNAFFDSKTLDATAPDASCVFCSSGARYYVEYECGKLQHRHPQVPVCKACCWLLSQTTGGQFTIFTKAFDGREELAQMKADALNAVQEMLEDGRISEGGHENDHIGKTDPRIPRDFWH